MSASSTSSPQALFFKNVRLVDPASGRDGLGTLLVENGLIKALDVDEGNVPPHAEIIDGQGWVLCPGLVDFRASLCEPGFEYRETLQSGSQAAVAGGVTTMGVEPTTMPVVDTPALAMFIRQRGHEIGLTTLVPLGAMTKSCAGAEMAEIGMMKAAGAMAFTDGPRAVPNAKQMRNIMAYAQFLDALLVLHPQETAFSKGASATSSPLAVRLGLRQVPAAAEAMQVQRDVQLAAMTGARIHFADISTRGALAHIRQAKAEGIQVSCDTSPPYFAMTEVAIEGFRTYAKLTPPLRTEDDRAAVVEGLADGTIDVVTSSHTPADADDKRLPFGDALPGGTGLATLLGVTLDASGLPLLEALALLTTRPAKLMGVEAGTMAPGRPADLCLFNPEEAWQVVAGQLPGLAQNTPFDGWTLKGVVKGTWRHGKAVYKSADKSSQLEGSQTA
ncbi:dihydroorotase [Formicincola oecophyllae]|uniref:Dihydroorotase n=1 Tax=Formicincola oecophyllae TaxID=2558361 RepID=A0A4Y6UAW5_9PROT|nr:dihydroorotase [Formicincola oecophyllae]QDH13718.1 dihydroorotase [Formicincola oecophyllae]